MNGINKDRLQSALFASSVSALLCTSGCGQQGILYLPTETVASQRASLPQSLLPRAGTTASGAPSAIASTTPASAAAVASDSPARAASAP